MDNIENNENIDFGNEIISWEVPEYHKHERTKRWYIIASIIALSLMTFAFLASNFLFAVIIILVSLVTIIHDGQEPIRARFTITDEGIMIGKKFHDYDEIEHFSIIYKPRINTKNLYFEFKNVFKQRLSIPLENANPLKVRENLLKYIEEDLERTDEPISESLAKMFKL